MNLPSRSQVSCSASSRRSLLPDRGQGFSWDGSSSSSYRSSYRQTSDSFRQTGDSFRQTGDQAEERADRGRPRGPIPAADTFGVCRRQEVVSVEKTQCPQDFSNEEVGPAATKRGHATEGSKRRWCGLIFVVVLVTSVSLACVGWQMSMKSQTRATLLEGEDTFSSIHDETEAGAIRASITAIPPFDPTENTHASPSPPAPQTPTRPPPTEIQTTPPSEEFLPVSNAIARFTGDDGIDFGMDIGVPPPHGDQGSTAIDPTQPAIAFLLSTSEPENSKETVAVLSTPLDHAASSTVSSEVWAGASEEQGEIGDDPDLAAALALSMVEASAPAPVAPSEQTTEQQAGIANVVDDPDLAEALALSMAGAEPSASAVAVAPENSEQHGGNIDQLDIANAEDDPELAAALALSLSEYEESQRSASLVPPVPDRLHLEYVGTPGGTVTVNSPTGPRSMEHVQYRHSTRDQLVGRNGFHICDGCDRTIYFEDGGFRRCRGEGYDLCKTCSPWCAGGAPVAGAVPPVPDKPYLRFLDKHTGTGSNAAPRGSAQVENAGRAKRDWQDSERGRLHSGPVPAERDPAQEEVRVAEQQTIPVSTIPEPFRDQNRMDIVHEESVFQETEPNPSASQQLLTTQEVGVVGQDCTSNEMPHNKSKGTTQIPSSFAGSPSVDHPSKMESQSAGDDAASSSASSTSPIIRPGNSSSASPSQWPFIIEQRDLVASLAEMITRESTNKCLPIDFPHFKRGTKAADSWILQVRTFSILQILLSEPSNIVYMR